MLALQGFDLSGFYEAVYLADPKMPVYRPKALPEFSYPPLGRRSNEGI
jgi:hypothetical protein